MLAPSRGRNMAQGLNKSFSEWPTVVKESNSNYMYKDFHWYNVEKMKLSRKGRERRGIWGKSECPTFPDYLLLYNHSVVGEQVPRVIDTITSHLILLWKGHHFYALNWRECGHKS